MRNALGFLSGLVFGVGLIMSGMANPAKVVNFLDLAGSWDPSLAFVMAGATAVAFAGNRFAWRRKSPLLTGGFELPTSTAIDRPLVLGAALFGVGWGIGGFCPGAAWTGLPLLSPGTLVFVPVMLAGLWLGLYGRNLDFFALQVNLRGGRLPEPESDGRHYLKLPVDRF